ncbi:hypothetical protein A0H81_06442 [Grifola frondosa]|uniref:Uncharacterized protein n=1 Tax=Grifola frondosa TaxID=5627 RepID=A0A1C7MFX9_GRIFR|nr:hypothetical protein A0H81_06442 [Grifola frondosa]
MFTTRGEVKVRSRIQKKTTRVSLPPSSDSASSESENVLPISYAAYTLPPSPLYSAGLNADRPPRHLLRFTLPTAQYQVSTIQDPLTGEIRSAPPKPQWLLDLEDNRAIIEIWVGPALWARKGVAEEPWESELLDSRISKTDLLSRSTDGEEQFPEELQTPLAVAEYLLEPSAQVSETAPPPDTSETENSRTFPEARQEAADSHSSLAVSTTELPPPESATSGLMRFLNGYTIYPNPLLRFTTQSRRSSTNVSTVTSELERRSSTGESKGSQSLGAPRQGTIMLSPRAVTNSMYPLSTVVIIALIAFQWDHCFGRSSPLQTSSML